MLKRYQVLLPDWLEDYVQFLVNKYDFSFSEVLRAEICCSILTSVSVLYPNYKPGISIEDVLKLVKEDAQENMEREEKQMLRKIANTLEEYATCYPSEEDGHTIIKMSRQDVWDVIEQIRNLIWK